MARFEPVRYLSYRYIKLMGFKNFWFLKSEVYSASLNGTCSVVAHSKSISALARRKQRDNAYCFIQLFNMLPRHYE